MIVNSNSPTKKTKLKFLAFKSNHAQDQATKGMQKWVKGFLVIQDEKSAETLC
jgi:hypothetical protein